MINSETFKTTHSTVADQTAWYPVGFDYYINSSTGAPELKVILDDNELSWSVDYIFGDSGIQLITEPEAGLSLVISRDIPFTQEIDFQTGIIDPEQIEEGFDRSVMRDQEIEDRMEQIEELPLEHEQRLDSIESKIPSTATAENQLVDLNYLSGEIVALNDGLQGQIDTNKGTMDDHIASTSNPHSVTASQVGLGNCNNTADLDKPVSTATQTALDGKVDKTTSAYKLYGTGAGGTQTTFTVDASDSANTVAYRDNNKQLQVAETPTDNKHAASKKYVDDGLAAKANTSSLATVATSGSYSDLSNKPTIPAAQVNSDWNAASGVAQILNKPSLATVATSGSYNDLTNKPSIPAAQVNSDWNAASGVAQILNKPTIGNATLTIQKNSTTIDSFTANATSDKTINISVPTNVTDLSDTSISSPSTGEVLTYDGTLQKWKNTTTTATVGWGGITGTLSNQTDLKNALDAKADATDLYHPNLFDTKWSDHITNDVQWLRGDTFSWQSGSVYSAAYDHLVDDIDGKLLTSETISGTTVQFYLADDGHKICPAAQESNIAAIYAATGVAWYYILDTANTRFKLPRTKFGFTGLRDTVGKYTTYDAASNAINELDWANKVSISSGTTITAPGYVYSQYSTGGNVNHKIAINGNEVDGLGMDHSGVLRPNSVVSTVDVVKFNGGTVYFVPSKALSQESLGTQMYLYFYVGQFTQTALENTAGLNASLFNGKMDLDMSNMNAGATAKATIVGWGMPDYTAGVAITTGYVATTDGVIIADFNWTQSYWQASIDGYVFVESNNASSAGQRSAGMCIAPRGSVFTTNATGTFTFFPLKGA